MILYAHSIGYREGIIQFQKAYMESELVKSLRHKYLLSLQIALEKYKNISPNLLLPLHPLNAHLEVDLGLLPYV